MKIYKDAISLDSMETPYGQGSDVSAALVDERTPSESRSQYFMRKWGEIVKVAPRIEIDKVEAGARAKAE